MILDFDKILQDANTRYAVAKLTAAGIPEKDWAYMAPEQFPQIQSDQVKAILEALVAAINSNHTPK